MTIPIISLLPTAPQSSDPSNFRANADLFVAALNTFDNEMNATVEGINAILPSLDAASVAVNFQGTWNSATAYTAGQSVAYLGITYLAILPSTNQDPTAATTYWTATSIANVIHAATAKTTLVDADEFGIWDSVSGLIRRVTLTALKSIFAVLNSPTFTGTPAAPTAIGSTNTTQVATTAHVKIAYASTDGTLGGVVKARINGTTLYLTTNGANA